MILNVSKTKVMLVTGKSVDKTLDDSPLPLRMNLSELEQVVVFNLLDLKIGSLLKLLAYSCMLDYYVD
jgi:hypothetical protein